MTRPTQPIMPDTATDEAVISEAAVTAMARISLVFTPSDSASSSVSESRPILQDSMTSTAAGRAMGRMIRPSSSVPTPASEPIRKYVIPSMDSTGYMIMTCHFR